MGPRGLEGERAGSRLPDQRIRRSARGLGHRGVRSVPADRRPGPEAARTAHDRPAAGRRSTWTWAISPACGRRSAGCSSGSWPGRAGLRGELAAGLRPAARFAPASRRRRSARRSTGWISDATRLKRCAARVFWMLAEFCAEFRLPFDLMIGPIRNVYPQGVAGGRDLFDRRVSLYDYRDLFNHFAGVTFPVSTLSPDAARRAGGLFLDLSQRASRWATGGIPTCRRSSRTTCARGCKPCPRPSCWDIIQMRTSSSSSRPSSTCTGGSWRMCSRKRRSAAAAGRSNGHCDLAKLILIDNPKRIFAEVAAAFRGRAFDPGPISRHLSM